MTDSHNSSDPQEPGTTDPSNLGVELLTGLIASIQTNTEMQGRLILQLQRFEAVFAAHAELVAENNDLSSGVNDLMGMFHEVVEEVSVRYDRIGDVGDLLREANRIYRAFS